MASSASDDATSPPAPDTDVSLLAEKLLAGDRRALSQAITMIESGNPQHRDTAQALLNALLPHTGKSIRLGITGVPGVGKSTFIETFGQFAIDQGYKVAVLAIDPSSPKTGGSILGDKTRMEKLARHPQAYIRPSPSRGMLGGIARKTYDTMLLCEAAGFDLIIIETVGVGQSETTVVNLVDVFMLLLAPASGDDLQGIKRGIMELADILVVNKSDGDLVAAAERVRRDMAAALHILRPRDDAWVPPVLVCSATQGNGITDIWQSLQDYRQTAGDLDKRRGQQARSLMELEIVETLLVDIQGDKKLGAQWHALEGNVIAGTCAPSEAARQLLTRYRQSG
ncbi:MAG: methylmalonyl Co-A mutase-associated GTPase MeaB [Rhodospirillales bacterium]|nr:methylmalonyl Co-A mutase-associated GTPase MeaB [Rhodospirillales bacterium]